MNRFLLLFTSSFLFFAATAQTIDTAHFREMPVSIQPGHLKLYGTITLPVTATGKIPVILFIAGSGPTDRNGNNPFGLQTDAYKLLAHALAGQHIATLRYDKRGTGKSINADTTTANKKKTLFCDEVADARAFIKLLKKDRRFSKVIVAGHSQGSLVGMLAASSGDAFISIAGLGFDGGTVIKRQLQSQPEYVREKAGIIIDSLRDGKLVKDVPGYLDVLFNPAMQPYVISWFQYDPAISLAHLKKPVLIIQGTNDIQIDTSDAIRLAAGSKRAKLVLIKNMNHVFRIIPGNMEENLKSYSEPGIPLSEELVSEIISFIRKQS